MKTLDYFKASQIGHHRHVAQLGRLTLYQAAEMMDAISNINVVCSHVLFNTGAERLLSRLDRLNGITLSLAQAHKVFKEWSKWTSYRENGSEIPTISQIQSFLLSDTISKLASND